MKTIKSLIFVLLAAMAFSCSSDDNNGSTSSNLFMKFTVNGTAYDISDPETIVSLSTAINAQQGTDADLRRLTLFIPNDATIGEHPITDEPSNVNAYGAIYFEGNDITVNAVSGTMNITTRTVDYIGGTFSFTGTDPDSGTTYTITSGSFKAWVD